MALVVDIGRFLGFGAKPRDGAVTGLPLSQVDQLVFFWNNRTTQSTNIQVIATVYNPENGQTRSFMAIGPLASTVTTFSGETPVFSSLGLFSEGELLTAIIVTTAQITDPTQLWCAVELFRNGRSIAWLCEGYVYNRHTVSWSPGSQGGLAQSAAANPATQGALFTFQGTLLNDGTNSGNHVFTLTAPTGGRVEVESLMCTNLDAAARTLTIVIDDGTNTLEHLYGSAGVALNASAAAIVPALGTSANAVGNLRGGANPITIAGANRIVGTLAAVAVSQDSAWAARLKVFGGAPTITITGPTGVTATTNTNRFETG